MMDRDLEQQLTAVFEGRAAGVPVAPADLGAVRSRARSIRRRRVAGGAAAGAAVVALLVPAALGVHGLRDAREAPPVGPAPTPTRTVPAPTCSATGVAKPTLPAGLPAAVATTWQEIVDAAAACDLSALEALGAEASTSFGPDAGITNLRRWERAGHGELGTLLKVMETTPGVGPTYDGVRFYGWPAIAVRDPWTDPTADEKAELSTFLPPEQVAAVSREHTYYGWRVGIRADGTWSWFKQGD